MVKTFSKAALAEQGSHLELSSPRLFSPSRFLSLSPPFFVCSRGVEDEGVFDSQSLYLRLYPSLVQLDDVESFIRPRPLLKARYVAHLRRGRPREVPCEFSVQVSTLSRARVVQTEAVETHRGLQRNHTRQICVCHISVGHTNAERWHWQRAQAPLIRGSLRSPAASSPFRPVYTTSNWKLHWDNTCNTPLKGRQRHRQEYICECLLRLCPVVHIIAHLFCLSSFLGAGLGPRTTCNLTK